MKLTSLSIAALVLALSGPAFADGHCGEMQKVGTDGDCIDVEEEPEVTMEEMVNADGDVEIVTTPVVEEEEPMDDPDEPEQERDNGSYEGNNGATDVTDS